MTKMTKAKIIKLCRDDFKNNPQLFTKDDKVAKNEHFFIIADTMCQNGEITEKQYSNWTNPF